MQKAAATAFVSASRRSALQQNASRSLLVRNCAAKDSRSGVEARALILQGVEQLAGAVKVTMGPKDGKTLYNELEVVLGMKLDPGYISPYFITNVKSSKVELESPVILIHEKKISGLNSILPLPGMVVRDRRRLLVSPHNHTAVRPMSGGLAEFFESGRDPSSDKKIVYGRSWKASELRLKSWDDLHKLWYVFLKEKNMLLSQKQMLLSQSLRMPNPERMSKVRKSMCRLKQVLTERALHVEDRQKRNILKRMINSM